MNIKFNKIKIFFVLIILILINYIFSNLLFRLDLSENKIYTLSRTTKEIIKNTDNITIKFYRSENLPNTVLNRYEYIKYLLEEYRLYSKNKISLEFIDPIKNDSYIKETESLNIPQVEVNNISKDQIEIQKIYFGIGVFYKDKIKSIPVVNNIETLEHNLSSLILKITQEDKTIGFYNNGNNFLLENYLKNNYIVKDINKSQEEVNTYNNLLILQKEEGFSEDDINRISNFITLNNKKVFLFIDSIKIESGLKLSNYNLENINNFLNEYNIKINNDLVFDYNSSILEVPDQNNSVMVPYRFWIKINDLVLPWTSSISILNNTQKDIQVEKILESSEKSGSQKNNFNINPDQEFKYENESKILGIKIINKKTNSQINLISNSRFLTDSFLENNENNLIFLENSIDAANFGDKLLNIKVKNIEEYPIKNLNNIQKNFIRILNIFGPSILLISVGLFFHIKKKNEKNNYINNYEK